jgi:uncharacterized protein
MYSDQAIQRPFGVSVFGSSSVRAAPDWVLVQFNVSCLAQQPKEAIKRMRESAQKIIAFAAKQLEIELKASRMTMESTHTYSGNDRKLLGYTAKIGYMLTSKDLEAVESLLIGLVDAGANEISKVTYQTSHLKEKRAEARRNAVVAARDKATNYCAAAGIELGPVLHIEDVNPDTLDDRYGHRAPPEPMVEDTTTSGVLDPGLIEIKAAVMVAFAIQS